jgi:predicted DNA-binding protein (MmcQ/YjbR family)
VTIVTVNDVIGYCMKKEFVTLSFPFGEIPICFKLYNKIFLELYPEKNDYKITVSCDPFEADCLRQIYKDVIVPGYHCPAMIRPYRNTIYLDNDVLSDNQIYEMIDASYFQVAKKLKKIERETLKIFSKDSSHKTITEV